MNGNANRWISSLIFGLIVGYTSGTPLMAALALVLGIFGISYDAGLDDNGLLVAAPVILQLSAAVAVTFFLLRISNGYRRAGWGCIILGILALLSIASIFVFTGDLDRDSATAAFFVLLIFGLPLLAVAIACLVGGWLLFRRAAREDEGQAEQDSAARSAAANNRPDAGEME
ncbi:MAG: hypothetical protein U0S50_12250 [Sphingopyxis sp.]|uniref:hypothetical protein n=1 Tax=Sphingopyxis sp. TaxID=1908224 RepID=UPI002AB828C8|nr:hypothetical protein [Sphingopyxis sp.]MDZ3832567.1 hypothetical protein [Sphingopyxis sp.]